MNDFENIKNLAESLQKEVWAIVKEDLPKIQQQIDSFSPSADAGLSQQVEQLQSNFSTLTTKVTSIENQTSTLSQSLEDAQEDIDSLTSSQSSTSLTISNMQAAISQLQTALSSLEDQVGEISDNLPSSQCTVVYDCSSEDADINRGLTDGLSVGYGINHNFKQYEYLKIYFRVPYWLVRSVKVEYLWKGDCRIPYFATKSDNSMTVSLLYLNSSMSNISFLSTHLIEFSGDKANDATVKYYETEGKTYGLIEKIEGYK